MKLYHAKVNQRKAGTAILILSVVYFRIMYLTTVSKYTKQN